MIHVYMDDLRPKPAGFVLARTGEECLLLLEEYQVDILSLDHDMGWDQPNGFEIVQKMVQKGLYPRQIYLHSSSVIGRMNMFQHLYQCKPEHVKLFQSPIKEDLLYRIAKEASHEDCT
jgi:hypothetical protein